MWEIPLSWCSYLDRSQCSPVSWTALLCFLLIFSNLLFYQKHSVPSRPHDSLPVKRSHLTAGNRTAFWFFFNIFNIWDLYIYLKLKKKRKKKEVRWPPCVCLFCGCALIRSLISLQSPQVHSFQFVSFLTDLTQTMSSKLFSSLNISRSFGTTFLHALSAHTQLMLVKEHVIL